MSQFSSWFTRCYNKWKKSQPGEEDFLAFCDQLGYAPAKVLGWLQDEVIPEGPEVLSIASFFGIDVYSALNLSKPDPELLKIFDLFSHVRGKDRSMLALAILESEKELQENNISTSSQKAQEILKTMFEKYGFSEKSAEQERKIS